MYFKAFKVEVKDQLGKELSVKLCRYVFLWQNNNNNDNKIK